MLEWRAGTGELLRSVTVSDELTAPILDMLGKTGVWVDPYRDQWLASESIAAFLEALHRAHEVAEKRIRQGVRDQLGLRELPNWSTAMLNAKLERDPVLPVLAALIDLCQHAMEHRLEIKILGQ